MGSFSDPATEGKPTIKTTEWLPQGHTVYILKHEADLSALPFCVLVGSRGCASMQPRRGLRLNRADNMLPPSAGLMGRVARVFHPINVRCECVESDRAE